MKCFAWSDLAESDDFRFVELRVFCDISIDYLGKILLSRLSFPQNSGITLYKVEQGIKNGPPSLESISQSALALPIYQNLLDFWNVENESDCFVAAHYHPADSTFT